MQVAKATHIFSAKITELDVLLPRTVNILTTNELVYDDALKNWALVCVYWSLHVDSKD